jgi:peptidyl-tRNA hydrolase, PTH1 family
MDADTDRPKFVVGLGNPGRAYAQTRHNVGFQVVDVLRRRWQVPDGRAAFSGSFYDARVHREGRMARVMMLEPMTFMNRSGMAVRQMVDFYKASPEDLLVVLDDMALPVGRLRARTEGSSGGHNGLSDIMAALGTQVFGRLRIGIGQPATTSQWKDFVLSSFSPQEAELIRLAVDQAAQAVEDWVFSGMSYVMERYNRKTDNE